MTGNIYFAFFLCEVQLLCPYFPTLWILKLYIMLKSILGSHFLFSAGESGLKSTCACHTAYDGISL